ncbi:MAG: hypothetical protein ABIW32_00870 [Terrimesophilobacter sp.]
MGGMRDTVGKNRSPKSFWFDPRLAIGIGLVVASVTGVIAVVTTADSSVLVYAASTPLTPGDRIYPGDLLETSVRLGSADDRYLSRGDVPAEGVLVTRTVSAGELVPASAVGAASSSRVASVVVRVSGELSHSIVPGTVTDVWSAAVTDERGFGPPSVLVGSVTVVRIVESSGLVRDAKGQIVELLVPRDKIARVLEAVVGGDTITLVPVSIPVAR